ncbi:MAG: accessory gene regulator B family protein [Bacilli bacterium]|nr:accessory gene regulator B family protein [Bacilli bacterium]
MIKKFIIKKAMKTIKNYYPEYNKEQLERIQYGLEAVYLTITKILVIIVASLVLKTFKETIIFLLLFNVLRTTGFGLHATKSWACWITSIPAFVCIPLICKYVEIPNLILITTAVISLTAFIFFAPADTEKRPLIRKKRRLIYKVLTILFGITYLLLTIFVDNLFLKKAIPFAMLIEAIVICPATYKLFKLPYNNYKRYKP